MIIFSDTLVVVFDKGGVNSYLRAFLPACPYVLRASDLPVGDGRFLDMLASRRNRVVRWFLDNTDLPWLLMLDRDMVVGDNTWPLFTCEYNVAGASYVRDAGVISHDVLGEVGCGCLRVSRVALEKIQPPWFQFTFDSTGENVELCECSYFCLKARSAGYTPTKVGRVGHLITMLAEPDDDGQVGFMFKRQLKMSVGIPSEHSPTHTHV